MGFAKGSMSAKGAKARQELASLASSSAPKGALSSWLVLDRHEVFLRTEGALGMAQRGNTWQKERSYPSTWQE